MRAPTPGTDGDAARTRGGPPHGKERRSTERRHFDELRRRLDALAPQTEELAEQLPEAIALRAERDHKLAIALARTVEAAIAESVRRNPREIAAAIHPVLGPAIRTAIAESMSGLVGSINRTIAHSITPRGLKWRFESWRTGVPFAEVVLKHSLLYRVEHVFLIHAETGLLLAHVPDNDTKDGTVISGMLTAIRDFVTDSFEPHDTGEIRRFSIGDVNLLTEEGPRAYIAAVVRGIPPESLSQRLERTLERIHLQWSTALASFAGDTAAFADTRPLLRELLHTVLATDGDSARVRAARIVRLAAVALLVVLLGGFFVRSERQWARAVERLEQEPGIVVIKAERAGGRWQFSGLRDPLAARPAMLLASVGADTTEIDGRWVPYVSTEPSLALERAQRILAPPATVTLELEGDTLVASGSAAADWIARAETIGSSLPGIAHLDRTNLRSSAGRVPADSARDLP